MSDGANDGGDPLEVIRDENQQLNNRVVIHTYGIGTGEWQTQTERFLKAAIAPFSQF